MSVKAKNNNISLIMGGIFAVMGIAVIFASGSPFEFMHKINMHQIIPPLWLWCLSTVIFDFLLGFALGVVWGEIFSKHTCREKEVSAYRGCIFFIVSFLLFLAHYPMLFVAERLLLAFLIAVISLVCACLCFVFWTKTSPISAVIIGAYVLWLVYLSYINAYTILSI